MSAGPYGRAGKFPTTRWSLLDRIRRGDTEAKREALDEVRGEETRARARLQQQFQVMRYNLYLRHQ